MKRISRFLLLSIFLAACANAETPTPVVTETSMATETLVFTDTPQTPPTETPDPLAGAPEGATGKDAKGNYIKTVVENGYPYEFTWHEGLKTWARPLGKMFGWDWSLDNGFPVRWFMAEGVEGGNIKEIVHQEFVASAFDDRSPLAGSINAIIKDRLGLSPSQLTGDLFDKGVKFSYIVDDASHEVTFDKDTGIKVFIVPPESLEGQEGVSHVTDGRVGNDALSLFSKLVGIDKEGELVFVVASPVPLDQLSEEHLRHMLVLNFTNFISGVDQTRQAYSTPVDRHARLSGEPRANGVPTVNIIWDK